MAITKRTGLGRPLTHAEMDANFEELRVERAGTATTGSNTYSDNQFITGSIKISGVISGSSLNVSDDIYLGDKIYDRTDTNQYVDFGAGALTFYSSGQMLEIKSGSGFTFGQSSVNHSMKIYANDTTGISGKTGNVKIWGTTTISGSEYTNNKLDGLYVDGGVSGSGTGSFGELTLTAPNGSKWSFSTNNSGHLSLTGSQV